MRVYMLFLVEMEHPFSLLSFRLSCYLLQRARRRGGGGWRKPLSIYGGKRIQTFEIEKSIPFPKNYKHPLKITRF